MKKKKKKPMLILIPLGSDAKGIILLKQVIISRRDKRPINI